MLRPTSLSAAVLAFSLPCFGQDSCPVTFIKVDPEANRLSRIIKSNTTPPPEFNIKIENNSGKDIRGAKFQAAYFDATEDLHLIPVAWNTTKGIKAGVEQTVSWDNSLYADRNHTAVGWIVVPMKLLFEDGTTWMATEDMQGCYGEYWKDKKHPRLTKIPVEVVRSKQPDGDSK